jgi:hypothetical protein
MQGHSRLNNDGPALGVEYYIEEWRFIYWAYLRFGFTNVCSFRIRRGHFCSERHFFARRLNPKSVLGGQSICKKTEIDHSSFISCSWV